MIILKDYLTASGKYPDREKHKEVTKELTNSAETLLKAVNELLGEFGINNVIVSSGFRPSDVNANIKGAAKKSLHMTGKAIDIEDKDGKLAKLLSSKPDILRKYSLFIENPSVTKGWVHLDMGSRLDRPNRMFNP